MKKTVAVVGLGYVGLPLALLARNKGWNVVGFDVDAKKIETITSGKAPFEDAYVATELGKEPLEASTDPVYIEQADVVVVAVPTPVTGDHLPDLTPLT
ncbi:MAG TPA: NAD(P)-binding domain-containing protein, partial [Candidatus Andersenbacteria bacterium]|nr:NAD(P)-binding domain-containing protein [Candidatus Andersenbacteria bacterium]